MFKYPSKHSWVSVKAATQSRDHIRLTVLFFAPYINLPTLLIFRGQGLLGYEIDLFPGSTTLTIVFFSNLRRHGSSSRPMSILFPNICTASKDESPLAEERCPLTNVHVTFQCHEYAVVQATVQSTCGNCVKHSQCRHHNAEHSTRTTSLSWYLAYTT